MGVVVACVVSLSRCGQRLLLVLRKNRRFGGLCARVFGLREWVLGCMLGGWWVLVVVSLCGILVFCVFVVVLFCLVCVFVFDVSQTGVFSHLVLSRLADC